MTAGFVALIVAAIGVAVGWNANGRRAWRRVGKRLSLRFSEESYWMRWQLEGRIRGCRVRVLNTRRGEREPYASVLTVHGRRPICTDVVIRAETLRTRAAKLMVGQDVIIGDGPFDSAVWLDGPPVELFAVLDARTRATLKRVLAGWTVEVDGGAIHFESRRLLTRADVMERLLLDCVTLAERLSRPADSPHAAALRNLEHEPVPEVRFRCVEALLESDPRWIPAAARLGMQDSEPSTRLIAALAAGPAGVETLEALLTWERLDEEDAREALAAIKQHAPARLRAIVETVLDRPAGGATGPALRLVGELGLRARIPTLNRLAQQPRYQPVIVDAARLLGDARLEPALVAALGSGEPTVRGRAADALGHFGTRKALQPLRAVTDRATRGVAARAIERIIQREAPGSGGGLSLADTATRGGLSSVAPAGGLSATREDE